MIFEVLEDCSTGEAKWNDIYVLCVMHVANECMEQASRIQLPTTKSPPPNPSDFKR